MTEDNSSRPEPIVTQETAIKSIVETARRQRLEQLLATRPSTPGHMFDSSIFAEKASNPLDVEQHLDGDEPVLTLEIDDGPSLI